MDHNYYANFENLPEAIVGFVQFARKKGLPVGVQDSKDAIQAAQVGLIHNYDTFKYSLKALFVTDKDEAEAFDPIFDTFWKSRANLIKSKTTYKNRSNLQKKSPGSLVWMGMGKSEEEGKDSGKNVSGANKIERLRKTDFSKVGEMDSRLLEELATKLWQQMSLRMKRRMKSAQSKGKIDLRKTIRKSIGQGGEPLQLMWKRRDPVKQRLIILLDVSGSMDKYSFFLLRFIWALRTHFERIEAFIFSTTLLRITPQLDGKDIEKTLAHLSGSVHHWSSGTQIGRCFQMFNDQYAKRMLCGRSTTIILSDGLDTGEPELLSDELEKIKRRTNKLIWLNPLKGMNGYEPTAKGMSAALPNIDLFRSAHSLNSLLELENYLTQVAM